MKKILFISLTVFFAGCNLLSIDKGIETITFYRWEGKVNVISSTTPINDFDFPYSQSVEDINGDLLIDGIIYKASILITDRRWIKGKEDIEFLNVWKDLMLADHKKRDIELFDVEWFTYKRQRQKSYIGLDGESYDISHIVNNVIWSGGKFSANRYDRIYIVWNVPLYSVHSKTVAALLLAKEIQD